MFVQHSPDQNRILAALPPVEFARLASALELVHLPLGQVLYNPGGAMKHAYFPTTSIVSLHYVLESGASAESAGVGNEGVVGIALFMGGESTPSSAVVQIAGFGFRLDALMLKQQFDTGGAMQALLLRYTSALIAQIAQTSACYRHHSIEQQLCRFLLLTQDRLACGDLVMTQELISSMLGVRREGITEAAGKLQRAGYIRYRRGHISIIDRQGLESHACECHTVIKAELARLASTLQHPAAAPKAVEDCIRLPVRTH
jgi:CRP-like cAMP-binding protein